MFNAIDIAGHLIRVGYDPDNPQESVLICPYRLQKLLYYCQGWSLALLDRALFHQPIEAWVSGPVVREVYDRYGGSAPIVPNANETEMPLPCTEKALVEMVWKEYASYLPKQLIAMTHGEPAWREARGDAPANQRMNTHLSLRTMEIYFADLAKRKAAPSKPGIPVINPLDAWRAEDEMVRTGSQGTPAADVFEELLGQAKM